MKRLAAGTLLTLIAFSSPSLAAGNNCATMSGYSQLKEGMSYSEATQVLGCEGEEMSSSSIAGFKTIMYTWQAKGVAGMMGGNMNAMFQNDRLISKAQFGLK